MGLTIGQWLGMRFRQAPVGRIRKALAKAEASGLSVTATDLEGHALAGGDPQRCVDALAKAHEAELDADWHTLCAIDLAGRDALGLVEQAAQPAQVTIDRTSPETSRPLEGVCRDGSVVSAKVELAYTPSLGHVVFTPGEGFPWHEAVALRVLAGINDASDVDALKANTDAQEQALREFLTGGRRKLKVQRLALTYEPAAVG